jgi:hypothetical protein
MRIDVRRSAYLPPSSAALLGLATGRPAASHEAWLLPPSEIVRLEAAPLPELFT